MPKIELSAAKGLKQSAGQGFCDADVQIHSGANISFASSDTAAKKGALIHIVSDTSHRNFTLPEAALCVKGQIKIVMCVSAAHNAVIQTTNTTLSGAVTLGSSDFSICVFNGTAWVVASSLQ